MVYSIIQKSQLEGANRLDAEYYQPEYLEISNILGKLKCIRILEDVSDNLASFGAYALTSNIVWKDKGIPFIEAANIKNGFIDYSDVSYIDDRVDEILQKSRVSEGQVLLSMSGSVGSAAVAFKIPPKLNSNQDIVNISPKNIISPFYLAAFLNSEYGKSQVLRLPVGSVQQHIFLWQTKKLLIPVFPGGFQKEIENIYKSAFKKQENSKILYQQAENLLLEELGLKDFKPRGDLSYVVNLSEVESANRLDSDFFQPKYDEILKKLSIYQLEPLEKHYEILKSKNFEYSEEGEVGVIKTKQLGKQFINFEVEDKTTSYIAIKENLPTIIDSDIIFASMGVGSLGKTDIFYGFECLTKNTIDSTLRIFRAKKTSKVLPEVSTIYLSSWVGQELIYKYVVGTSGIISIYEDYLKNFTLPVIQKSIQQKIADLVRKSHEARKKSKELLEEAKRKVEEMIEKSPAGRNRNCGKKLKS